MERNSGHRESCVRLGFRQDSPLVAAASQAGRSSLEGRPLRVASSLSLRVVVVPVPVAARARRTPNGPLGQRAIRGLGLWLCCPGQPATLRREPAARAACAPKEAASTSGAFKLPQPRPDHRPAAGRPRPGKLRASGLAKVPRTGPEAGAAPAPAQALGACHGPLRLSESAIVPAAVGLQVVGPRRPHAKESWTCAQRPSGRAIRACPGRFSAPWRTPRPWQRARTPVAGACRRGSCAIATAGTVPPTLGDNAATAETKRIERPHPCPQAWMPRTRARASTADAAAAAVMEPVP